MTFRPYYVTMIKDINEIDCENFSQGKNIRRKIKKYRENKGNVQPRIL